MVLVAAVRRPWPIPVSESRTHARRIAMSPATVPQPQEASADPAWEVEKQLQGTWEFASGRWPCQLFFAAHNFAVRFQNGEVYMGIYTVDPTQKPAAMDMTIEEGPDRHRGLTSLCLYELDGDTLRWRPNEPGRDERHTEFTAGDVGKYPTLIFRRDGL
jgi:uncharacterized protein (TIGR03067 family)